MGHRLMCVVAHPDDECYAFGGALALAADRGIETFVVCTTDGQAAKNRGDAESGLELGRMRRAEFAASCKVLGVKEYELLDHQDGQMKDVGFTDAAEQLVSRIRKIRPNVIITFGSDGGMNTHPDHMMVSFLTTAAYQWAGQAKHFPDAGATFSPDRLYHVTTNCFLPNRQPPRPIPWSAALDIRSVKERKSDAFRQHVSQAPLMEATKTFFKEHGDEEFYALIASDKPQPVHQVTDLFEGL